MPIDPPDIEPPPKWAVTLVNAARSRNRARDPQNPVPFSHEDLIVAWKKSEGRCALSGLDFDLRIVGDGQAKRPFAPSLDRLDRHKPYHRDNVQLIVSVANFAMNAWGPEPLLELASALRRKFGERSRGRARAPSDSNLDDLATIDADLVETNIGIVNFPPRTDMRRPILDFLADGSKCSRKIENMLARRFGITDDLSP